jgi:hypothetical protein
MQLDGGTFTAQRVVAWQGPDMQLDGGTFTADEAAGWAGPDMQLDAGTFSARDSASWTGPDMALDAGTFTITTLVAVDWTGPDMQLAGGSWSWSLMGDSYEGTQYVDGALDFTGATTVYLDESVYPIGGNYVLFQYGSFPGGQADLNAYLTIDASDLALSFVEVVQDKPHKSHVVARLKSNPTNGKQFVDGDLTFSGATTLYLDGELYATDGTYELFEVTGTVTGLANVTCISEAGLFCGAPFLDGNLVKVTIT